MIRTIFLKVINMSITASVVICAVIFIRWLFRKQPKIYSYILWSMVLFRLLCPVSISLNTSVFNIFSPATVNNGQIEYSIPSEGISPFTEPENSSDEKTNIDVIYNTEEIPIVSADTQIIISENNAPTENIIVHTEKPKTDFLHIASIIWLIGGIYILFNNLISIIDIKDILKNSKYVRRNIYSNEIIPTAFIMGIVNPKIYIPENLTDEQQEYVLMHEEIHIKRKDYLFKLLGFVAVCIHWFNPLVWLAYRLAENDMEMSCDEAVVKDLGVKGKAGYSQTLLSISVPKNNQYAMHLAFGEGETKSRIVNVLNFKKPGVKYVAVIGIVTVVAAVCLMFNPSKTNPFKIIGINKKDVVDAVLLSENKFLHLDDNLSYTVADNLAKVQLSPAKTENNYEKSNHSVFLTTENKNYSINFNDDFTQLWVLSDEFENNGVVYNIESSENIKYFVTDNIDHNWSPENVKNTEAVFYTVDNESIDAISYRAVDTYIKNHIECDIYHINEVLFVEKDDPSPAFEYIADYTDNYDYVLYGKCRMFSNDITVPTKDFTVILYIRKINDCTYKTVAGYSTDISVVKPSGNEITETHTRVVSFPAKVNRVIDYTMPLGTYKIVSEGKKGLFYETVKSTYDENYNVIKEEIIDTVVIRDGVPGLTKQGSIWNGGIIEGGDGQLIWPTAAGRISRGFTGQYPSHNGIDIAGPVGTYIYAADSGVVAKAIYSNVGYGIYCIIEHGGYQTVYAQCSELLVDVGQIVQEGQVIAKMGSSGNSTGPHLHFEVKRGDTRYDPYDWF